MARCGEKQQKLQQLANQRGVYERGSEMARGSVAGGAVAGCAAAAAAGAAAAAAAASKAFACASPNVAVGGFAGQEAAPQGGST